MLRQKGWSRCENLLCKGVEERGNIKSSRDSKFQVTRWFLCREVVGIEAREEGEATHHGLSPECTGEPWKDFEQGRNRVRYVLQKNPLGCHWRVGGEW